MASFLGVSNLLLGQVSGADLIRLDGGTEVRVLPDALQGRTGRVAVGIRPEKIRIGGEVNALAGKVFERAYVGVSTQYVVDTPAGRSRCTSRTRSRVQDLRRRAIRSRSASTPSDLRRRHLGGTVNPRLTRQELIRRATFGAALVSIPGFAAACGGESDDGSSGEGARDHAPASRTGRTTSTSTKAKKRPTLEEFKQKFG